MDLEFASKYPFSEKARNFLNKENILAVSDEELEDAARRLLSDLRKEEYRQKEPKKQIVSYVIARIYIGALNNYTASSKFSKFEAKRSIEHLKKENLDVVFEIGNEFFPSLVFEKENFEIDVIDYLKFGSDLPNQELREGKVHFDKPGFLHLLEMAIAQKIGDISFSSKSLPENIKKHIESLKAEAEKLLLSEGGSALSFKGKYLNLPAMKKILQGLPEGKRYYGSMTLAIACIKDNLSKEGAEAVMIEYVRNCNKTTHDFTEREALATLEWVYRHPTINFSMKTLREQGLVDEATLRASDIELRRLGGGFPKR